MVKKHTPAPEGYYDDDADEVADLDAEHASLRARWQQRIIAVFGTSYGISVVVHLAIIAILATIIIATPPPENEAQISVKHPIPTIPPDPTAKLDEKDQVEIPLPETDVHQVTHEDVSTEIPMGEPDMPSDVPLPTINAAAAVGIGPGGGGLAGQRGTGPPAGSGGGPKTEHSVLAALRWLRDHQAPDGRWEAERWAANCKRGRCAGPGWNEGSGHHDAGVSGLALLAFLGNGNTHRFGKLEFRATVRRGLRWLRAQQAADGSVGLHGEAEQIYGHAIATMVLCESYLMTRDPDLRGPAQRATDFLLAAQNPGLGWKYGVRSGKNDTSVTGWAVLALKAARTAGLEVPDAAFDGARTWFDRATNDAGDAGYESAGGGSSYLPGMDQAFDELPVNTSVAVLCRVLMGERRSVDALRRGSKLIMAEQPTWKAPAATRTVNFYYWYYGTYAMYQLGGEPWLEWNEAMKAALLPAQRADGCARGSWDPVDPWSIVGGRVYATALNALTMEIYYRYKREQEKPAAPAAPADGK